MMGGRTNARYSDGVSVDLSDTLTGYGCAFMEIVDSLRQLRAAVMLTVGACSRCGAEARLLCGLVAV
jgi:hypothetical protein